MKNIKYVAYLLIITVPIISALSIIPLKQFDTTYNAVKHTHTVINNITKLNNFIDETIESQRGYIISGQDHYRTDFYKYHKETLKEVDILKNITKDNDKHQNNISLLKPILNERLDISLALIETRKAKGFDAAVRISKNSNSVVTLSKVRSIMNSMYSEEQNILNEKMAKSRDFSKNALACTLLMGVVLVGSLVGIVFQQSYFNRKREQSDRFFNLSQDMLCIAGHDTKFKKVNPAWETTLGYSESELLQHSFLDLIHPDDIKATTREAEGIATGEGTEFFENRYLAKNGEYRWLLWKSTNSPEEQLVYATARDITDRKKDEINLRNAYRLLERRNKEMINDLEMAKRVQQTLITQGSPTLTYQGKNNCLNLQMSNKYYLSSELGGDLSCFLPISDTKVGILVCDVMGHGVRSALLSTVLKILAEDLCKRHNTASGFLENLNKSFINLVRASEEVLFATAIYLVVDLKDQTIRIANAGHFNPISICKESGKVNSADFGVEPGTAMGIFERAQYKEKVYPIIGNEFLMLFTDGIVEVENKYGDLLGSDKLMQIVEKYSDYDFSEFFDVVVAEVRKLSKAENFIDDVCLVGLQITKCTEESDGDITT
jgi:PAS domain S-box-containing protein